MGAEELNPYAHAFGFDQRLPWRLGGSGGSFPDPAGMDEANVAQVSFGQGEVLATPMQMALVAAAVANGGQIMRPYVVSEVRDYSQTGAGDDQTRGLAATDTSATAATLRDLMVKVVQEGTGTRAAIEGVKVAGKTGTAEVGEGVAHSWFIGFAPADAPRVAVAVVVERGTAASAPIARDVMAAALGM